MTKTSLKEERLAALTDDGDGPDGPDGGREQPEQVSVQRVDEGRWRCMC